MKERLLLASRLTVSACWSRAEETLALKIWLKKAANT